MSNIVLEAKHMKKVYNMMTSSEFEALHDINIQVMEGDFVAVMGPSGSGKSTFINNISTIDIPSGGKVFINGKEIFFVAPNSLCEIKTPLDSTKDLIEYHPSPYCSSILLFGGNLAVFESIDVHAGGIATNTSELVQKVVVKIPKDLVKLNF